MAGGDVFAAAQVPAIGLSCTNPSVTALCDYYWRICFLDPFQGSVMANFASTLSGGEQQMLAVGRDMMMRPKLLMMDEPSLGLAPLVIRDIFRIIQTLHEEGITILLVEQNANAALRIADSAYVLETGSITMHGTGRELLDDPQVKEAYLGKAKTAQGK